MGKFIQDLPVVGAKRVEVEEARICNGLRSPCRVCGSSGIMSSLGSWKAPTPHAREIGFF
jgi:hypothetical protein